MELIAKRHILEERSTVNHTELAEMSKLCNTRKTYNMRAYNKAVIEEALEIRGSLRIT